MNASMPLAIVLEVVPYFAIALICIGVVIDWMRRSDAYQKALKAEIDRIGYPADSLKDVASPQTRPTFITIVLIILFVAFMLASAKTVVENARLRSEVSLQRKILLGALAEKRSFDRDAAKLKNEIGELRAQKALYTATIETLSKKDSAGR